MFTCNRNLVVFTRLSKSLLRPIQFAEKHVCNSINPKVICSRLIRQLSTNDNCQTTTIVKQPKTLETLESAMEPKDSTCENQLHEPDYNAITNGDNDLMHKLKVFMLEAEVLRQEGFMVPQQSFMTTEMWKELLKRDSRSSRKKYFVYLFKMAKTKEKRMLKKLEKQQEFDEKKSELVKKSLPIEEHALSYGLQHNIIFLRIQDQTMNKMENNKLFQAMRFGEKIVIDCGYDKNMTKRENVNCAKQLMLVFAENRAHRDPYDLHFCNINRNHDMAQALKKHIPTMDDLDFPINIHEKSYLDLYPKEKLVYLTPHCNQDMLEYNPNEIYIIGAIVDKINNEPLSLAKAKREGIKMMKFPLDKYLSWGAGSGKSLTLNHCVSILLDLKISGNWEYSLRHVPRRKLADEEVFVNKKSFKKFSDFGTSKKKWTPRVQINTVFKE